jgi:hypothetical protein
MAPFLHHPNPRRLSALCSLPPHSPILQSSPSFGFRSVCSRFFGFARSWLSLGFVLFDLLGSLFVCISWPVLDCFLTLLSCVYLCFALLSSVLFEFLITFLDFLFCLFF